MAYFPCNNVQSDIAKAIIGKIPVFEWQSIASPNVSVGNNEVSPWYTLPEDIGMTCGYRITFRWGNTWYYHYNTSGTKYTQGSASENIAIGIDNANRKVRCINYDSRGILANISRLVLTGVEDA